MTVEVRYLGHLGNNLFQYALGRILAEALGQELVCRAAADARRWAQVEQMSGVVDRFIEQSAALVDAPQSLPGAVFAGPQLRYVIEEKLNWSGHGINLPYLFCHGRGKRIVLHGYFQRAEYYLPYRAQIRRWFAFKDALPAVKLGPRDVLVDLRQSLDMRMLDRAIDLSFYSETLASMAPMRVYVCGLGLGPAVRAALAPFDPVYLDLPALATLKVMMHAERIVLANSTFSWWGAWLSQASEVVYPRVTRNFWSRDRADVALEVPEARYRYVEHVAIQEWRPFQPRADVVWSQEAPQRVVVRGARGALTLTPGADLLALCAWLAERREAFGLIDLDDIELSPAARHDAPRLLLALARQGLLTVEDEVQTALAAVYGEVGRSA